MLYFGKSIPFVVSRIIAPTLPPYFMTFHGRRNFKDSIKFMDLEMES